MSTKRLKTVRPDAKGRITLGRVAEGVSSYSVSYDKNNRIILEPMVEIPANEKWLFNNKSALAQVKQGLKDAALGRVKSKGSFVEYLEDDTE
jgi:hypothetical protein